MSDKEAARGILTWCALCGLFTRCVDDGEAFSCADQAGCAARQEADRRLIAGTPPPAMEGEAGPGEGRA